MAGAEVIWATQWRPGPGVPFPSIADSLRLVGELTLAAGALAVLRDRLPRTERSGILDALILATGFGIVSWVWFMDPLAEGAASPVELGVALAYPIIDVAILGILSRLAMAPGPRGPADRWLLLGLGAFLVADVARSGFGPHDADGPSSLVSMTFLLAWTAFAVAALHPSSRVIVVGPVQDAEGLSSRRMLVLMGATLLSPLVLLTQASLGNEIDMTLIASGTLILFSLVLARLFLAVTEPRRTLGDRQTLEAELKRQALHDPLTGLANRLLFSDRLAHALTRRREQVAVLYLDLDDFKTVNDTLGHEAGDELLTRAAARIRSGTRLHDTAARLGG